MLGHMQTSKIIILASLILFLGCNTSSKQASVQINNTIYSVKSAISSTEQIQGLMYIEQMPEDEGMLFIFKEDAERSFWMKNMLIPLDIIYINSNNKIVSISRNAVPCTVTDKNQTKCPSYKSEKPAKYVLEINAGESLKQGFNVNDNVKISLQ
jgi:hypothetical protein